MRWEQMRGMEAGKFRRLTGVKPAVFEQMRGAALAAEFASTHPVRGARRGPKPKLSLEDRLLLLLMYYREYRTFAHLGASFGVSEAQSWRIITGLEQRLMADGRFHLSRQQSLRADAHWQGVVVDVGECAVEGPKKAARLLLGQKEAPHPERRRGCLNAAPGASKAVRVGKGRRHDFHLSKQSRTHVHPDVEVFCDTGYQGLQKLHANTRKPHKATKKRPLTREQKRANRQVNSRRAAVEHAVRHLKVFRLLGERYRNRRRRFGLRVNLIAALTNLQL